MGNPFVGLQGQLQYTLPGLHHTAKARAAIIYTTKYQAHHMEVGSTDTQTHNTTNMQSQLQPCDGFNTSNYKPRVVAFSGTNLHVPMIQLG